MDHTEADRPRAGTATGRVWDIADELTRRDGTRARRAAVIDAYVREGGNPNTANTQFQRWRRAHEETRKDLSLPPAPLALQIKDGGRIVLPSEVRSALGASEGETLIAQIEDGELRLFTRKQALRRARELIRRFVPEGRSLADELIAERREEARREAGE
jgi:AbrB family looped-hinge helix DNA binding protein